MSTNTSILLVDDDQDLLENMGLALDAEDFRILTANDGIEALEILQSQPVNLILADIAMPNMNGYQLYEKVCQNPEWVRIPFIFLTARTMDSDIRFGKELGVDDYLTKPIRSEDLLAVVHGKLRRSQQVADAIQDLAPPDATSEILALGGLQIDPSQHRVWLDKQELQLSAKEFALLAHLVQEAGKVVATQILVQSTHQYNADLIEAGTLARPLIMSLRRKLGLQAGEVGYIANVRGIGYRVVMP